MKKLFLLAIICLLTTGVAYADDTTTTETSSLAVGVNQLHMQMNGGEALRGFPIPQTHYYPPIPNEFLNDTHYSNILPVKHILIFGQRYKYRQLKKMAENGWVKSNLINIDDKSVFPDDDVEITFIIGLPKDKKLKKIGSISCRGKTRDTSTENVLGEMGLQALTVEGAKYVLLTVEGAQKSTSTFGFGISLGYTHAGVSADNDEGQVGSAGIGFTFGNAGRVAEPFLYGVILTDE